MTRENIVDNKFILYGDQIAMIKDALASHKYTIANIMERSMKKGDLEHKNIWESFGPLQVFFLLQLCSKASTLSTKQALITIIC